MNNRQNIRQFVRALLFAKQSLFLIDKNASNSSKNQKFSTNVDRFDNVYRNRDNSRFKNKTYVIDEKDEKKYENENVVFEIDDDVYYNNDLNYYDSNNSKNENLNDEKSKTHFVVSILAFVFVCRRCNERFTFNN